MEAYEGERICRRFRGRWSSSFWAIGGVVADGEEEADEWRVMDTGTARLATRYSSGWMYE